MNVDALIHRLASFPVAVEATVHGVSREDLAWRPDGGGWSITEILRHLLDEDREDFGLRLRMLIEDPAAPWPGIDPEGWAKSRAYAEADPEETLWTFAVERENAVRWLRTLREVDWAVPYLHPRLGPIRRGDLLAAWAAHDLFHHRQIIKRLFQIVGRDAGTFTTSYAGAWTA
ncbi:MAG: DinB family protein [Phycisphaeraceae bacterium]|nr:DinB family protein [Phycisphaeraceae bacterium]